MLTGPVADARTGKVLRRWSDSGKNARGFEAVTFSDDGRLCASSDGDAVHVWEVATCAKVHTFRGHLDEIGSLSFSAYSTSSATHQAFMPTAAMPTETAAQ